jgi:hypothetical protein
MSNAFFTHLMAPYSLSALWYTAQVNIFHRQEYSRESDDCDVVLPAPPEDSGPVEEVEDEEEDGKETEEDQVSLGKLNQVLTVYRYNYTILLS